MNRQEKGDRSVTEPQLIGIAGLSCRVCVPADWEDAAVTAFAERANPCGTTTGWQIRRAGDPLLRGDPERATCAERPGCVHLVLDA